MKEAPSKVPQKQAKNLRIGTPILITALIIIVLGSVIFAGALAGWFSNNRATLDENDHCYENCDRDFNELTAEEYEEKVNNGDSFVLFVDQTGCYTADGLREFVLNWSASKGVKPYKMMFSTVKNSSLHDYVKYYPSVGVISKGHPIVWLRADEDEDSDAYNYEDKFNEWLSKYLN